MASLLEAYNQKELPENYFRATVQVFRCMGIELVREETLWYSVYSKFILFVLVYSYTCVEAYELYANWGDLNGITNVLNYLATHIIGSVKITFLFLHRCRVKAMIQKLHQGLFVPDVNRGGAQEAIAIRSVVRATELQLSIFFVMIALVLVGGVTVAMRDWINPRAERHLTYLNISIIDTTYSPAFEVAFFYQMFCIIPVGLLIASTDVFRTSLMAHVAVQLNILQQAFRNMQERAVNLQNSPSGRGKSLDDCLKAVVADSINHHLMIFELGKETEELNSGVLLVGMLSSVMQLCFLLYQTSLVPVHSVVFFQYVSYWSAIFFQAGVYCYWGNEVTLESEAVAKGVAGSNWVDSPNSVSKSLVLIMARAQKPFNMTAGNFVPLSLPVFMSIVKGSFSYFMVLKQMNEGKTLPGQ